MIAQIGPEPGSHTYGLLHDLYGPGKGDYEEQLNPHMIAAWDPFEPDPAQDPAATLTTLAAHLNRPIPITRPLRRHLWHCAIRAAPDDPTLTDAQWADISFEIADAAGISPHGDDQACRWVAIRHAGDHTHIVATLTRQDGKIPNLHNNWINVRAACRRIENRYGLRRTTPPGKAL